MSNKNSNFPSNQLNSIPADVCGKTITSIREFAQSGKPQSIAELQTRIDQFFEFCAESQFRPGIEALSLALGISRVTFWNWCNGINCDEQWKEVCCTARQYIAVFLEQISMSGHLNPATSIFLYKNWLNYKDTISFDEAAPTTGKGRMLTAAELPKLGTLTKDAVELPDLRNYEEDRLAD